MRLLGARDPKVQLDLGRFGVRDVEAETGGDQTAGSGSSDLQEFPPRDCRHYPRASLKLTQGWTSVKFETHAGVQPVDISRSERSSGSGLRSRSMRRGSHRMTTPVTPEDSWSRSIAAHASRSGGAGMDTQVSPSGRPPTTRPPLSLRSVTSGSVSDNRNMMRSVMTAIAPSMTERPGPSPSSPIIAAPAPRGHR